MRVLGVIPARLGSTRLLNKPLQLLAGEPLVTRVVERVAAYELVDRLVVATDSPMVVQVVERTGVSAVLTDDTHSTGTERVAEVAARAEYRDFDVIVNIQGDEPFIDREALEGSLARVEQGDEVGTAAAPLELALVKDPARVKVITDLNGRALYFSRAVIPHRREADDPADGLYWQHLGLYAYTRSSLARWVGLPPTQAELAERLEQLRALQHGMTIGVTRLSASVLPGVDTPDDLKRAEAHWHALVR
jgi:3-deoxy-manno-octulosonate cytidylyltransferase (CMP-KDO synthetase)